MNASRRRFLAGGVGLAAAAGGAGLAGLLEDGDWLARLTGHPAGDRDYRRIGAAYLDHHPDEADRAVLIERLGLDPATVDHLDGDRIADVVFRGIQRDVARDDLVSVRRWLLTRTEARLFALGTLAG